MKNKPFFLTEDFMPVHGKARMQNVGDAENSRNWFLKKRHNNLDYLLRKRYSWMNEYIKPNDIGIEVGAGAGFSKLYINNKNLQVTDFANFEWLDKKMVDAMSLPYESDSLDFIIESNMIHHLSKPSLFFEEVNRVLKKDGVLLIQDVWGSLLLRILCNVMQTEGYSFNIDVFNKELECCDPNNLWAGNNVMLNLLFYDKSNFEMHIPFKIEKLKLSEVLIFPLSGGVTSKVNMPILPKIILRLIDKLDDLLIAFAPNLFALQVQIVLIKK